VDLFRSITDVLDHAISLYYGRHPEVLVDGVHNDRCCDFSDGATSSPTSYDVVDRLTVDVSAKTPYNRTDVCGDVEWYIAVNILKDNDEDAGTSVTDLIGDKSRTTCKCPPGCSS
jgi:hypothetical protein